MPWFLKPKVKANDNVKITKDNQDEMTLTKTILKLYKFNNFNHEQLLPLRIAEMKANFFTPKKINLIIEQQRQLANDIENFFLKINFNTKNWIVNNIASLYGKSGWLICNSGNEITPQLNILPVRFINRNYDILGKLVKAEIAYDDYLIGQQTLQLQEIYTIDFQNKKVNVERQVFNISNSKIVDWKDKTYNINQHLAVTQKLDITYIPIILWPNLPNEKADCAYSMERIKALDIAFEYIILDWIINSPRIVINENQIGASEAEITTLIKDWIVNSVLVTEFDPEDGLPIEVINTAIKGKTLTDCYDWLKTMIYKETGVHVAAAAKGAQQTIVESTSQNIETNNLLEQQINLREIATIEVIKMLLRFDNDILKAQTFKFKDNIDNLKINVELEINRTLQKQLQGVNNGTEKTTNTIPT